MICITYLSYNCNIP